MPLVDPHPRRTGEVELPDGRRLAYAEYGDLDGTPMLFVPGAATSSRMNFGPVALAERGVRLISLDRPGLGHSSPAPTGTLLSFAEDVGVLLERLAVGRVPAVANSQGAPFGLACAQTEVISALALVSPADEVAYEPVRQQLLPDLQRLVEEVGQDPEAAEGRFAAFTADAMFDMVMSVVPDGDRTVYADPGFVTLYRAALEDGFAQGSAGYAHDTRLAMSRWPLQPTEIEVPVSIWFGAEDASHSPDLGQTLAARLTGSRRHVLAGVGGSLLWSSPGPILDELLAR
ncbi:MAG: alpha/beta hydrolase [Propionibacteriaceae bacterium]